MDIPEDRSTRRASDTGDCEQKIIHDIHQPAALPKNSEDALEEHLKIDRHAPLSLGTAVHMMTAAARSHLYNNKGYVYIDTHETGTSSMYLSERFALENFSAVLRITAGRLVDFPKTSKLVQFHFTSPLPGHVLFV